MLYECMAFLSVVDHGFNFWSEQTKT